MKKSEKSMEIELETKKILIESLFDSKWYSEVFNVHDLPPVEHFLLYGASEGKNPNKDFDIKWYLNEYSDVSESGLNPFVHYLQIGKEEGRFQNDREKENEFKRLKSLIEPFMDEDWYRRTFNVHGISVAEHFLLYGVYEKKNPNKYFDIEWYLSEYSDDIGSGINPLVHYIETGKEEGKFPNKKEKDRFLFVRELQAYFEENKEDVSDLSDYLPAEMNKEAHHSTVNIGIVSGRILSQEKRKEYSSEELAEIDASGLFFADWYRGKYDLPEAVDPLEHYFENAQENDPNPLFNTKWYYETYAEKVEGKALLHYIRSGWREGCSPSYHFDAGKYAKRYGVAEEPLSHYLKTGRKRGYETFFYDYGFARLRQIIESGLFFYDWYKRKYDIPIEIDPLVHFCDTGWKEGYDPNPLFDLVWYRERYIKDNDINPLFHYLDEGFKKGYAPSCDFDALGYSREHRLDTEPLAHYFTRGHRLFFDRIPLLDCKITERESV